MHGALPKYDQVFRVNVHSMHVSQSHDAQTLQVSATRILLAVTQIEEEIMM